ncbi:hypothetical protein HanXRQr2_Chr14g0668841 [Helianthus annuus]|uniref:Uncharacterized protein n=1 Tax=Helianthus annuus TaxID=4232 RepID=A0A251SMX0_HELAN|nr:hypothetical protein HanXRQr2_Chr14g0668841 [Helianthus annuus]KAJ0471118.1 hypothetical protein HanIR_Chr14g0726231 [Helianthus annuus]KAJ0661813.1 hypothetical protein HanOQP8_Chr14g0552661 [Helianthus annuus]
MLYQLSTLSLKLTFSLSNPDHTICRENQRKKKAWVISREHGASMASPKKDILL